MDDNRNALSSTMAAFAADVVLVLHAGFALFAVLGAPLVLIDPRIAILHLPVVGWSSIVNLAHWTCPLTPLEQRLRRRAGQVSYKGGWLQHYIDPVLRPLGMPRKMELVAGISVVLWNIIVYGVIWTLRHSDGS